VVLGAIGSNGVFTVDGDRITLVEAIAKAGDLAQNARIDRIKVIREEEGGRKVYVHDLRKMETFYSPAFYLQQNDIVYVEPKYKKKDAEERGIQYTTLILSITSSLTTILWYLNSNR
jgi:polysaccharide export outer membrane protein